MYGDLKLWFKEKWKQFKCEHDYKNISYKWGICPYDIYKCKHCGRIK
jgi:hypothetical protein